jgi:hypothetical protein
VVLANQPICRLAIQFQTRFLESIPRPIAGLKFSTQNDNDLSPSSYTHISVKDLYFSRIGLPILLQENAWIDPGNIYIAHRHMNVLIGTPRK